MNVGRKIMLGVTLASAFMVLIIAMGSSGFVSADAPIDGILEDNFKFGKNLAVWFMLMMVAFLMIFIKKYEWGVALAVLLSAAGSFVAYLAIQDFYFDQAWDQTLMIRAVICAITLVIAIGVFLGTVKMWQYLFVGLLFAPVYAFVEWFMGSTEVLGGFAVDPGGSILVHMCAAYFGLGVALTLRRKEAFNEPQHTTTHSVSFVWLAAMILWVLWPAFVTSLLGPADIAMGTMTCYMAGIGSVISAYVVCTVVQKKVNPLIYTYAMLAGPVAIGAPLLSMDAEWAPWGALALGLIAGAISAISFIYLQPRLCKALGIVDVMGVHNLHGIGGWIGVFASALIIGSFTNVAVAIAVVAITLALGAVIGIVLRLTGGKVSEEQMFSDDADFIKNEAPSES